MSECVVLSAGVDVSDADAALGDVRTGKHFYSVEEPRKTGTIPEVAIVAGSENVPAGIHVATTLSTIDADLVSAKILNAITIFGVTGHIDVRNVSDANALIAEVKSGRTFYAVGGAKKTGNMPTVAIVAANDVYSAGYHAGNVGGLDAIDVHLTPANIKSGVNIFGKVGTYTGPTLSPIFERYWTGSLTDNQIYTPAVGGMWGGTGNYGIKVYYYSWDVGQPPDHAGIHVGQTGYFRIRNESGGTATGLLYRAVMQNTNPLFDYVWDGELVDDATYTPSLRGFYNIAGNSYASIKNYTGSVWLVVQDDQEGYLKNAICSGAGSMRVTQEFYDRWNVLTRTY